MLTAGRRKAKPTACGRCYGKFLDLDMFGKPITFNVHGRETFDTFCGVLFTLVIAVVTVTYAILVVKRYSVELDVPLVKTQVLPEYFPSGPDNQVSQKTASDDFEFAVAISSLSDFAD